MPENEKIFIRGMCKRCNGYKRCEVRDDSIKCRACFLTKDKPCDSYEPCSKCGGVGHLNIWAGVRDKDGLRPLSKDEILEIYTQIFCADGACLGYTDESFPSFVFSIYHQPRLIMVNGLNVEFIEELE